MCLLLSKVFVCDFKLLRDFALPIFLVVDLEEDNIASSIVLFG